MRLIEVTPMTDALLLSSSATEDYSAYSGSVVYATGDKVISDDADGNPRIYQSLAGKSAAVSITVASPAVINWTAHGLTANTPVSFDAAGGGPVTSGGTQISQNTIYYVIPIDADTFNISTTSGGSALNTTGTAVSPITGYAGPNAAQTPPNDTYWVDTGPSNTWAMFDESPATTTSATGSLTVKIDQTDSDAIALMDMDGVMNVTLNAYDGLGVKQQSVSFDLDGVQTQFFFLTANAPFLPWADGPLEVVLSDASTGGILDFSDPNNSALLGVI